MSQLKFKLTPNLGSTKRRDPDAVNFQDTYAECVRTILGSTAHVGWVDKEKGTSDHIEEVCEDLGCTVRQFILTNLIGHRETAPDREFYPRQLAGDGAVSRYKSYRKLCASKYGTFDVAVLERLHGNVTDDKILNSELQAGRWIVGWKMRHGGFPFDSFLKFNEIRMDPVWLAIEPSYEEFIGAEDDASATTIRHRNKVSRVLGELKRKKTKARDAFRAREDAAPIAVCKVLREHGLDPNSVYYHKASVDDMITLWSQIGLVLQHLAVRSYLDGNRSALKKIAHGQICTDD